MRYCFLRSLAALRLKGCLGIRVTVLTLVLTVFGLTWGSEAHAAVNLWRVNSYDQPTDTTAQGACVKLNGKPYSFIEWKAEFTNLYVCNAYFDAANGGGRAASITSPPLIRVCNNGTEYQPTSLTDERCPADPPNCAAPELLNKYRGAGVTGPSGSADAPALICVQGCGYVGGSVMVTTPKGSAYEYSGRLGAATGQACTTANYDLIDTTMYDASKDVPPSPLSCADQGKVYGTVNGVGICANGGSIPGSTVKTIETKTSQQTDASGVQSAPQTETTAYSVGNINGVPVVGWTVTHADGSKSTGTQDQDGFCRENPSASPCRGGGGGGGKDDKGVAAGGDTCQAAPVCSGDAIQCMMVKQQWHTRCDSNQPNSLSDLGQKLIDNQDPVANPAAQANRTVNPISSSIDQTAFLSGGGLSDKIVTVSGQSITLPFSRLNQYLVWIGHLFVVLSLIGAIRIVLGGFK